MTDPGIRLAVGVSGAGKTYSIRADVYRAARECPVMVIDRMKEWTRGDAGVRSVADGARAVADGARLVIVRPQDVVQATEEACRWARDYSGLAGVAVPEAHRALPNGGRLAPAVEDCVTAWRHHRVALWLDTQRLSLLNRTVTEQARELRLFAIVGDLDLRAVSELGGRELVAAVRACAQRLADGEPGWHVQLGLVRVPPYRVVRESVTRGNR
jgi:hypothetical protein